MNAVLHFADVSAAARTGAVCRINDLRIRSRELCVLYGLSPELQELLIRLATGAAAADTGTVSILGTNAGDCAERVWFQLVEKIAVLDPAIAVSGRISIGEYLADAFLTRDPPLGEPALSRSVLRIAETMKFTIAELSMNFAASPAPLQWKARLGRHLATRPRLLMLPLNLEDEETARILPRLLRRVRRKLGIAMIAFASNAEIAQQIADRVVFLNPETGDVVENRLRGWYHRFFPFLGISRARRQQLAATIAQIQTSTLRRVSWQNSKRSPR